MCISYIYIYIIYIDYVYIYYIYSMSVYVHMDVSINGGTPKPPMFFKQIFHNRPSSLGYPHSRKPPLMDLTGFTGIAWGLMGFYEIQ